MGTYPAHSLPLSLRSPLEPTTMTIKLYMSSISSSLELKKHVQKIQLTLDGHKVDYENVDLAKQKGALQEMRKAMGDDKALPPQIFNGDQYCGDYDAFINAVEAEDGLWDFLKLPVPPKEEA